jgi:PAS domain S-box-containing protein
MRGHKPHVSKAKGRVGRARKTRTDLEQELKVCRREIAHARERLAEATMQQTATSEMLRIISNSPIQSVLDAVAENAARLSDADNAEIFRLEDNLLRLAASYGQIPVVIHAYQGVPVNRDTVTGRAACDRRTIQVHDLAAEEGEYPVGSGNAKREGHRTTLGTPLLREGTPVGIILVRRREVRPFSAEQIALIETFADQAVIAIENARLFEAEKQRTLALAHANRDLAEREAKIRRLVDSNVIGIFTWDFDGRFLGVNDEFLRIVGYDREDLLGGSIRWTDLTPPEWRDMSNRRMEQQRSSGRFEPFEKEYARKDGRRVPVLIGGATFEEGGDQGVAFVLDLTERKSVEHALRESELKHRAIIETMPSMLWATSPDGEPTHVSQRVLDYAGMRFEDFLNLGWKQFLHPEDFPETARAFFHAIQTGEPYEAVHRLRRVDGQYRWHHARGEPLRDKEQRIIQWYGLTVDIDERKRAEEQLRRSESYLAEAQLELAHANRVATVGQLTASITHEVNQPITAAVTYASAARRLLSALPPNFREVDDVLSLIVKEGNRAGEVVGRIRALIKKAPARKDAVAINDAILEIIALTRTEAASHNVLMLTELAEGLPRVQGDRVQLQQVLLNLIINAIEAMRDVDQGERELLISSRSEPDGVSVEVRDSGPGFAPGDIDRVFEAFYSTKSSGLGLGLSICRSIIEAHNGRLWAIPNVPRGAIFGFIAPAHPAAVS